MKADGLVLKDVRFDDDTAFEVKRAFLPDEIPQGLVHASIRALSKRRWRYSKSYSRPVRFMLWLTGHSFSFHRLVFAGVAVVLVFTGLFTFGGSGLFAAFLASLSYFLNANTTHPPGLFLALGLLEALLGMLFFAILTALLVSTLFDKN
jgi:hypothetical protein